MEPNLSEELSNMHLGDSDLELRNRAGDSISPYVRAHADTPVAWQLLDDEAIAIARRENKLIFMNVGFHACHCKHQPNRPSRLSPPS
jgi:hypothetical protein